MSFTKWFFKREIQETPQTVYVCLTHQKRERTTIDVLVKSLKDIHISHRNIKTSKPKHRVVFTCLNGEHYWTNCIHHSVPEVYSD